MSLLPTAHAGQAFGSRRIDFFTVSGQVAQSEAHTGHVVDHDGMEHDVRLMEDTSALAQGDTATVLRVQAGPNRRSRPVALVNHSRGVWMRAAPDATSLLSRSGVTRTLNWWISVLMLVLVAAASVWPVLHAFLSEVNAGMMAAIPVFDIYADIAARAPALASWRLETALPAGLFDALASLGFISMDQLTEWGLALGAAALSVVAFAARSWRLIYIPALAALAISAGAVLGGADATLYVVAGAISIFMLGGLFNRIRDGGRFNARVERLAEHVLRNPPQEEVKSGDTNGKSESSAGVLPAAAAAAAIATAASVADGDAEAEGSDSSDDAEATEDETKAAEAAGEAAEPDETAANGETEAGTKSTDDDLPPPPAAESDTSTDDASDGGDTDSETAAADQTTAQSEDQPASETSEPSEDAASEAGDTSTKPVEAAKSETEGGTIASEAANDTTETAAADASEAKPAASADDAADAPSAEDLPDASEESPVTASADQDDAGEDDLPSLDDVAAVNALDGEEEIKKADSETPDALTLEDDRTMPVASPPPMAAPAENAADEKENSEEADAEAKSGEDAGEKADEPVATHAQPAEGEGTGDVGEPDTAIAAEAKQDAAAPVDDPVIDDAADPMVNESASGDLAPGAPEIELDESPAQ